MFLFEPHDQNLQGPIVISVGEILGAELCWRLNLSRSQLTKMTMTRSAQIVTHLRRRKATENTRLIFLDHPTACDTFLVAQHIRLSLPDVKLIYLAGTLDLVRLYLASACGFSVIASLEDTPLSVLTSVARKRPYLSQSALCLYALYGDVHAVLGRLTLAQLLVLMHMTHRQSPEEIARHLSCSVESIYQHQARLRTAFNVCSNNEVLALIGFPDGN